jgi:uncharacterized protein
MKDLSKINSYIILTIKSILIFFSIFVVFATVFGLFMLKKDYQEIKNTTLKPDIYVVIGDTKFNVQRVSEYEDRQRGLSGIQKIQDKEGMLFIFDTVDYHGIWMKDMNFPIDIIWLDEFFVIVNFEKNVSPKTFPKVFKPDMKSKYVLELRAGSIDKYFIFHNEQVDLIFK